MMSDIVEKYTLLIESLDMKQRKYMHYRSVANFIDHLEDIQLSDEMQNCEIALSSYLEEVKYKVDVLTSGAVTTSLYIDFLLPLANIYNEIGFKKIWPLRLSLFFAVNVDIIVGVIFLSFPNPILTLLTVIHYFAFERKYYKAGKVYGMLY